MLLGITMLLCSFSAAQQQDQAGSAEQNIAAGVLQPKVVCAGRPDQSYALYLPSHYISSKSWPIVYAFDPAARGSVPVELIKDAAERNGYIVVGSNNSRNGPSQAEAEAAQAVFADTHARFSIDNHRIYFAGFSGGARLAASIAQRCKCAAGVFLNGAGFSPSAPPSSPATFAVFATVGTLDFNYPEVVTLDATLGSLRYAHQLRRFEGPHQWSPAEVAQEAVAWFRLIAMREGHEPRDDAFVQAQANLARQRATELESSGEPYYAWREYLQAAETFDNLGAAQPFRDRAAAMQNDKPVRDGARREQQEFEEQRRLTADISQGLVALMRDDPNRADLRVQVGHQIAQLRSAAEHEKRPQKTRVLQRALTGVFVQAMEAGEDRLRDKDVAQARDYFELACEATPNSFWALRELAVARAWSGDRKGVLQALGLAKRNTNDPASFASWLAEEPAFAKFRDTPEFRSLLGEAPHQ